MITETLKFFTPAQVGIVHKAAELAENLVIDHYKMSESQWLRNRYDINTLSPDMPLPGADSPLAQVTAWRGFPKRSSLPSAAYDFYRITLYDSIILAKLREWDDVELFPLCLYVICHELIHIVRFTQFNQLIDVSTPERQREEQWVHGRTHHILSSTPLEIPGLPSVLDFFKNWVEPIDALQPVMEIDQIET
jgi:hypothetical protein